MTHIVFRDYFRNFCLLETNLSCSIFNRDHFEGFINNTSVCEKLDIFYVYFEYNYVILKEINISILNK